MKQRKCDPGTRNPVWEGTIDDRYYYMIKNREGPPGTWTVPYSDIPEYEKHIWQVDVVQGGMWSLIETDIPLPIKPNEGRLLVHGEVEALKLKLKESHDENVDSGEKDPVTGEPIYVNQPGKPVTESELFGGGK